MNDKQDSNHSILALMITICGGGVVVLVARMMMVTQPPPPPQPNPNPPNQTHQARTHLQPNAGARQITPCMRVSAGCTTSLGGSLSLAWREATGCRLCRLCRLLWGLARAGRGICRREANGWFPAAASPKLFGWGFESTGVAWGLEWVRGMAMFDWIY